MTEMFECVHKIRLIRDSLGFAFVCVHDCGNLANNICIKTEPCLCLLNGSRKLLVRYETRLETMGKEMFLIHTVDMFLLETHKRRSIERLLFMHKIKKEILRIRTQE